MNIFKTFFLSITTILLVLISALSPTRIVEGQANSAKELIGSSEAKRHFGPDVRGSLLIRQIGGNWQARKSSK